MIHIYAYIHIYIYTQYIRVGLHINMYIIQICMRIYLYIDPYIHNMYVICLIHQYLLFARRHGLRDGSNCKAQARTSRHLDIPLGWIHSTKPWVKPHPGEKPGAGLRWDATDEPKRRQSCTTPHGFHHSGQPKIGSKMANPKNVDSWKDSFSREIPTLLKYCAKQPFPSTQKKTSTPRPALICCAHCLSRPKISTNYNKFHPKATAG